MTHVPWPNSREDIVKDFHAYFGHPIDGTWDADTIELRVKLISEEVRELFDAIGDVFVNPYEGCEAAMLKEMADVQVVLSGLAVVLGLNLNEAFLRVMESNMSKLGADGKPILREDGKILKGPNYREPDLTDLVQHKGKQDDD